MKELGRLSCAEVSYISFQIFSMQPKLPAEPAVPLTSLHFDDYLCLISEQASLCPSQTSLFHSLCLWFKWHITLLSWIFEFWKYLI